MRRRVRVPREPRDEKAGYDRVTAAVTGVASLAALAVALSFPAAYLLSASDRLSGRLEARTQQYADAVSDAATQSPQLYNAFLSGTGFDPNGTTIFSTNESADERPSEQRQVFAGDGALLFEAEARSALQWPVLTTSAPVLQNGHRLGEVRLSQSMRSQVLTALAIAAGSFTLGGFLLVGLRLAPLRLMKEAIERASFLSAHDQLTRLPNRMLLADRLEQALRAVQRKPGQMVAMYCLDLDHFKQVNDTLGHAAGDVLLQTVTARLSDCLRESDTLARLGGDEFAVVQLDVAGPEDARALAGRLIEAAREPVIIDTHKVFVGLSIGIALSASDVEASELTKQADIALYQAKAAGRGGYCFFAPEMNGAMLRRKEIENDLRTALELGALQLHYQPQIDLNTGAIIGAEALMRWNRPGHGPMAPNDFIPVAEETGLIVPMGALLLMQACHEAATWPETMRVAVNVSPIQFRYAGFLEFVRKALASSGLDPCRLELEVTEGILIKDTEETLAILAELRAIGVRLAMDDFGTGYASLGYLQKFRFDKIKIDRSFVKSLGADVHADAIVRAVVGMGEALGISTNAEGVENSEQAARLLAHGCKEVQGFLYSHPVPPKALHALFEPARRVA